MKLSYPFYKVVALIGVVGGMSGKWSLGVLIAIVYILLYIRDERGKR